MRTLRKLLLGETWFLPAGIAIVVLLGALVEALAPGAWTDLGGPALLLAVLVVLAASVRRGS